MIGKTALALAAATMIVMAAALFVGAAGFSLYFALEGPFGPAGAAGAVAGACGLALGLAAALTNMRPSPPQMDPRDAPAPHLNSLMSSFGDTIKERPLLTIALTALTGLAASRDANILRDLWGALLNPRDRDPKT